MTRIIKAVARMRNKKTSAARGERIRHVHMRKGFGATLKR